MLRFKDFEKFHKSFQGEFYNICFECGGKCEYSTIAALLPGEKQYIALKLGISIKKFKNQYLDAIITPYGIVEILKLNSKCPFLQNNYVCSIRYIKPILCAIYPIILFKAEPEIKFKIDSCPLSQNPIIYRYLNEIGIPILKKLPIPKEWVKAVLLFDKYNYNYNTLKKLRKTNKYQKFKLKEIQKYILQ